MSKQANNAEGPMLRSWSANLEERRTIERFLDWCEERRPSVEMCEWTEHANWPSPVPGGRGALLDAYHEIDQQQLDRERRALLDAARAQSVAQ
jgi:hypothetical protein